MLFVVVDGCKMLRNSSFDSMSHFVQDEFQSTNSEEKHKHIQYMSKTQKTTTTTTTTTYPQHILQTHRKHIQKQTIEINFHLPGPVPSWVPGWLSRCISPFCL